MTFGLKRGNTSGKTTLFLLYKTLYKQLCKNLHVIFLFSNDCNLARCAVLQVMRKPDTLLYAYLRNVPTSQQMIRILKNKLLDERNV